MELGEHVERLLVLSKVQHRDAGKKPCPAFEAVIGRNAADRRECLLVFGQVGVDVPQLDPRALERPVDAKCLRQKADLGGGGLGDQALDVLLERRNRRMPQLHRLDGDARARHQAPRDPGVDVKNLRQRPALHDLRRHPPGVDADRPRPHDDVLILDLERADNHLTGAEQLAKADHGGMTERRNRRHAQPFERPQPILPRNRRRAEGDQVVGEDDR
jgi:hypothetical protein